jgi:glycosyltransferase involved in cell wall biosynthesis
MPIIINAKFLTQPTTGVQRFAGEISRYIKKYHPDIVFVAPHNIIHHKLATELGAQAIGKFTGVLWEQYELPKFLKTLHNPLLLNLANVAPLFYQNQVITIHDLGFYTHPEWYSFKFKAFYNFLIPKIIRNSKQIITVSEFSKKEITKHFAVRQDKVEVVYNAVSSSFFSTPSLPTRDQKDYLLAVSSLDPRKNFRHLIKAFNAISGNAVELYIVGSESKTFADPEIKSLIVQNPRIKLLGYVTDEQLVQLYQHAKLFIYPSLYEGFGIPPLEAMACGCPTIVSDLDVMKEIFADACHFIDPHDLADLTNSINYILDNKTYRDQLRAKGFETVKRYSWESSAKNVMKVLNNHIHLEKV